MITVNLLRKYFGFLDILLIWITEWHAFRYNFYEAYQTLAEHESQLVWFRKFFIIFSRYTYANSFDRFYQKESSPFSSENSKQIVDENVDMNTTNSSSKTTKSDKLQD